MLEGASKPQGITESLVVEREGLCNLYFGAVAFIYDVKRGALHSLILYDISGVLGSRGNINKLPIHYFSKVIILLMDFM